MLTLDDLTIDQDAAEVRRNGAAMKVEPLILDLLAYFARNPGRLITKQELLEQVWKGKAVSDAALTQAVAVLRRVLGDDGRRAEVIQTVRGRGYRMPASRGSTGVGPATLTTSANTPFVGRHGLMRDLDAALEAAVDGRGGIFLLHGAAGSGKSRVCDELAGNARRRGVRVAKARSAGRADMAQQPWLALVEDMQASGLAEEAGISERLEGLLPCLRRSVSPEGSLKSEAVADAILAAVAMIAHRTPLLVIVDDIHEGDLGSLTTLVRISRNQVGLPVLLVATYRGAELARAPARTKLVADLQCLPTTQSAALEGLSREETARLLQLLTGQAYDGQRLDEVFRKTAGNPLAVAEAARLDRSARGAP